MNPIYCDHCKKDMKAKANNTSGYYCQDCIKYARKREVTFVIPKGDDYITFDLSDRFKKAG